MIQNYRFVRYITVIICCFSSFMQGVAQENQSQPSLSKKIEIINSDSLKFDRKRGAELKLLYGHVIFKQDNVMMYCDSAHFFSAQNQFNAYSKIHIIQGDTIDIWGDSLQYAGNIKLAQIRGNVKMRDRKTILTTQKFDYDMNASIGKYFEGGKIIDEENTLISINGTYFSNKKELFFKTNVKLKNKEYDLITDTLRYNTNTHIATFCGPTRMFNKDAQVFTKKGWYNSRTDVSQLEKDSWVHDKEKRISGDSIYYDRRKKWGHVNGHVTIIDTAQQSTVKGNYAYFKEKPEYYLVRDSVLMLKEFEGDPLFLHADSLIGFTTDTVKNYRIVKAFHKVRFFKSDIQGKCDSLVYKTQDSIIIMHRSEELV